MIDDAVNVCAPPWWVPMKRGATLAAAIARARERYDAMALIYLAHHTRKGDN